MMGLIRSNEGQPASVLFLNVSLAIKTSLGHASRREYKNLPPCGSDLLVPTSIASMCGYLSL